MDGVELLRRRSVVLRGIGSRIIRRLAICAPHTFELACVHIDDDNPPIDVTVRDKSLIRLGVEIDVCGVVKILGIETAFAFPTMADLQQEFARRSEFQDLILRTLTQARAACGSYPDVALGIN